MCNIVVSGIFDNFLAPRPPLDSREEARGRKIKKVDFGLIQFGKIQAFGDLQCAFFFMIKSEAKSDFNAGQKNAICAVYESHGSRIYIL